MWLNVDTCVKCSWISYQCHMWLEDILQRVIAIIVKTTHSPFKTKLLLL